MAVTDPTTNMTVVASPGCGGLVPNRASENIFAISSGDHRTSSAPPPDPVELEGQRIAKAVQAQRPDKVSAIETPLVALIFDFSKGWWGNTLGNSAKAGLSFSCIVFHDHFWFFTEEAP